MVSAFDGHLLAMGEQTNQKFGSEERHSRLLSINNSKFIHSNMGKICKFYSKALI